MRDMATPVVIHRLPEAGSTQEVARDLAELGAEMPLLVVADRQTHGRGRTGRSWESAPRALACSLAISPDVAADRRSIIPLITGLEARSALSDVTGVTPGLKWPNDLVTDAGKVGGILVEGFDDLVVIGVGINLWWPDPPQGFAAALDDDPGPEKAPEIAAMLANQLVASLGVAPEEWDRPGYEEACVTLGERITWEPDGAGLAVGIAADGGLIVDTGQGTETIRSGEVHTVRAASLEADHDQGRQQ